MTDSFKGAGCVLGVFFAQAYAAVEPRSCREAAMSVSEGWKGGDELAWRPVIAKGWVVELLKASSRKLYKHGEAYTDPETSSG